MSDSAKSKTALIIGASRGLGRAMVAEYLQRGWRVVATVRGNHPGDLRDLAAASQGELLVEELDINLPEQVADLRARLAGDPIDLLFVNAGVTNGDFEISEVSTETFNEVMVTNALSPMRVVEALQDLVPHSGTIGVMSSHQGSVALNNNAGYEVYRASKSALNQLMRSFAARHADDPRTLLLLAPGWVRTALGGPNAALSIDESVPKVVDTIEKEAGNGGLRFVDYRGNTVPW
ncbi:SDR family NAD(P)-dependent oxidoreductase [Streptomyces chartreusis]|uniref:SDR family NAD(P)-dependent oxidoreductase n=1 Tax=Streptomyces chartreusis TaxID=1969 RepID=UPI0036C8B974